MHVVHYRRDLGSVENAGHYDSGIRVIGVFFRVWMQAEMLTNIFSLQLIVKPVAHNTSHDQ
jgi:hypothetical protein